MWKRVEFRRIRVQERLKRQRRRTQRADDRAVMRTDPKDAHGAEIAPGTGHILDDHFRRTGDIFPDVTRDRPGVEIVCASRSRSGNDRHQTFGVELRDRIGACAADDHRKQRRQHGTDQHPDYSRVETLSA